MLLDKFSKSLDFYLTSPIANFHLFLPTLWGIMGCKHFRIADVQSHLNSDYLYGVSFLTTFTWTILAKLYRSLQRLGTHDMYCP